MTHSTEQARTNWQRNVRRRARAGEALARPGQLEVLLRASLAFPSSRRDQDGRIHRSDGQFQTEPFE